MNLLVEFADINWQLTIFAIVGGLGIFLYGINLMGDSLKALAGTKLKVIIEKTTNTPIKGIIAGFVITVLIQSSSGTTAITIGLVRAGLMTLPQAVGIILGANIGTTITSFLLGLPIKQYALPIMALGSFFIFFTGKKRFKQLGGVMLGFGMLFYGLDVMGGALKQLAELNAFKDALLAVEDHPFWGLLVGAGTTAIIQSSSATIGILQELYTTGAIPLLAAVAIVFGNNIGTTVTAILASIGGSVAAKRTAAAHVFFNIVGSLLFMIVLVPYTRVLQLIQDNYFGGADDKLIISFAHMGFNVFNTFVMFFFVKQLVWLVSQIIRGDDGIVGIDEEALQEDLINEAPALALESAKNVIMNMGRLSKQMIDSTIEYSFKNDSKLFENGMQIEEMLDTIDKKAHDYLVRLSQNDLTGRLSQLQAEYVDTIRDFERIGDHCTNLMQFFEERYDNKMQFTPDAKKELERLYDVIKEVIELTLYTFEHYDKETALKVLDREDVVDRLVIKNRKRHVMRINNKESSETQDGFYVDILSNIERISDHCSNIAINIMQENYYNEELDYEY